MSATYREIVASALAWFRYRKQCPIVSIERGIYLGNPDVCAVSKTRRFLEIEIKTSLQDFKRDKLKWKWKYYGAGAEGVRKPYQFWYLVPPDLVEKVKPLLPEGAGLMTLDKTSCNGVQDIAVMRPAKKNDMAPKLDTKTIIHMTKHQSGSLVSLARDNAYFAKRYREENVS